MADGNVSKQARRYGEKLKSLNDLIINLQDQAKKLEAKKTSKQRRIYPRAAGQVPGLDTLTTLNTLQQQGFKETLTNEQIQRKGKLQVATADVSPVISKHCDVRANYVAARNIKEKRPNQSPGLSHKAQPSQAVGQGQKIGPLKRTGPDQESKITDFVDSNTGTSDTRLSRLAKEVWNRKADKLFKVRHTMLKSSYKIQRHTKAGAHFSHKELLEKGIADHRKNIYKLDNGKSHSVTISLPDNSNSPFSFIHPYKHKSLGSLQGTKSKYVKDIMHWSSGGLSKENINAFTSYGMQNNDKEPTGTSLSSFTSGVVSKSESLHTPNSLKLSSERLSSLAKETWKKSTVRGPSNSKEGLRRFNMLITAKSKRSTRYMMPLVRHYDVVSKSENIGDKKWKKSISYGDPSTNDRLSNLAKKIWQNRTQFPRFSNKHIAHRSLTRSKSLKSGPASKFIWRSNDERGNSFLNRRRRAVLKQSRYKIVRGHDFKRSVSNRGRIQKRINKGEEAKVLFTSLQGKKFVTDTKGRRLIRLSLSSPIPSHGRNPTDPLQGNFLFPLAHRESINSPSSSRYKIVRKQSITHNASSKIVTANRMVKKSLFHLHQQTTRKFVKKQYCMFYNRFGKCKNGDRCRYIHDPEKIAVCTRYLRGTCKDDSCLFSHKIDSRKMPTCMFFLNGVCHRENCPYAHIKVRGTAEICKDFLKGYCPSGDKCLKRHMLECEEFSKRGSCSEGDRCKLYHRKRAYKRRRSSSISGTKAPKPFTKRLRYRRSSDELLNLKETTESELKIKPSFTCTENIDWGVTGMKRLKRKRRFDWKRDTELE